MEEKYDYLKNDTFELGIFGGELLKKVRKSFETQNG